MNQHTMSPEPAGERKPYSTPSVQVYGSLAEMTSTVKNAGADDGPPAPSVKQTH
jgi:hypothetical protein